jgi:hypothetical protein
MATNFLSPVLSPVDEWNGLPVHYKDSLALNVVVRDEKRLEIFVSFATMERLRRNSAMKAEAVALTQRPGIHTIPETLPIPGHHVGRLFKDALATLNSTAAGVDDVTREESLRLEIAELRGLLDEAEAALDTNAWIRSCRG